MFNHTPVRLFAVTPAGEAFLVSTDAGTVEDSVHALNLIAEFEQAEDA